MSFQSLTEITDLCAKENLPFWEIILKDDMNERAVSREASWQIMESMWNAMLDASRNYDAGLFSRSGLVGGQGGKMENFVKEKKNLSGDFCGSVIARALQMGESNACMKRIVAAPTAGACGVLPAVLVTCLEQNSVSEPLIIQSLYTAAGIGEVIAQRASISERFRGLSGRDRHCQRHGCRSSRFTAEWHSGADYPCRRYGSEKSARSCLRPGGRSGRSPLRQAERDRSCQRHRLRRHGHGRHPQQNRPGPGHRCHENRGRYDEYLTERNRAGRTRRHAGRTQIPRTAPNSL